MLIIEVPPTYPAERKYVCDVVFGEFLGLQYRMAAADRSDVRVTLQGDSEHREVLLADVFFQTPEHDWLTPRALPATPIRWVTLSGRLAELVGDRLPLLFAADRGAPSTSTTLLASADLLGSIFFLLTRYEEALGATLDEHDRFPGRISVAEREHFLDRPLADEYVEILWHSLSTTWPLLSRRDSCYRLLLSHDVDWPLCNQRIPIRQALRSTAGDIVRRGDPSLGLRRMRSWFDHRRAHYDSDPFNTFDLIMDVSERKGLQSTFYFIAERRHAVDGNYNLDDEWIQSLLLRIHRRGHEIGLHGSYTTFRDPSQLQLEVARLKDSCAAIGINQRTWGGRQHYLRWENPTTWQAYSDAGLDYDSTLTFADHVGFRCGTCHEYPVYNLRTHRLLALRERPLVVMEASLFGYQHLGFGAALEQMGALKRACQRVRGELTLLWHNSSLGSKAEKRAYQQAVDLLAA